MALLLLVTSVMSDSVRPHPWDSPGKNTGVGCHFLLQCIKLSIFILLSSHYFHPLPEFFIFPNWNSELKPIKHYPHSFPNSCSPWLGVSMNLTTVGTSCKWSHIAFIVFMTSLWLSACCPHGSSILQQVPESPCFLRLNSVWMNHWWTLAWFPLSGYHE